MTHTFSDTPLSETGGNSGAGSATPPVSTPPAAPATPAPAGGTDASTSAQVVITDMSDSGETREAYAPPASPVIVPNLLSGMLGITTPMIGAQTALFGPAMGMRMPLAPVMPLTPVI